jgi:hypothetical protein
MSSRGRYGSVQFGSVLYGHLTCYKTRNDLCFIIKIKIIISLQLIILMIRPLLFINYSTLDITRLGAVSSFHTNFQNL